MRSKVFRRGGLAVFVGGLLLTQTASADVLRNFRVANWVAGAYSNDQTNTFSHCAASRTYVSGITMMFAINRQYQWSIGFANSAWTLAPGTIFDVAFAIDNDPPIYGSATALTGQQVAVRLTDSVALFQRFQRGYQLKVFAGGQILPFNLTDTSQVLPALLQCVGQYANPPQQALLSINPFASPPAGFPKTSPANRAEATTLAANILGQSGITGFQIFGPNDIPPGVDAVWRAGSVFGTVSVLEPDGKTKINDIPAILISRAAQTCPDKFFSGSLPDEADQSSIARVFLSCQTPKKTSLIYFIVVPRDQGSGGLYLLAITTEQSKAEPPTEERAREMENSVRKAVFKVLSK